MKKEIINIRCFDIKEEYKKKIKKINRYVIFDDLVVVLGRRRRRLNCRRFCASRPEINQLKLKLVKGKKTHLILMPRNTCNSHSILSA
jgi:hypothetical protein